MSQERTEKPTRKRLRKARREGQIARSRDLALAAASVAATIALARFGGRLMNGAAERLAHDLAHFGDAPTRSLTAGDANGIVITGGAAIAMLVGPIALSTMVVGVLTHGFQGGWSFAPGAMKLKWSRLNPASGFKKFGLMQSGMETVKTFVSVAVITALGWSAVAAAVQDGPRLAWLMPAGSALMAWGYAEWLLWRVAIGLGVLAIGDYGLQRYRMMKSLRMTKREVKDEVRQNEGNPHVKGKIRRIQMEMSRRRMLSAVPRATVVITNPTHYAVALEYRRGSMAAPVVLAKGRDLVAARIREQARRHGVPIVENKPLAQALYRACEIGDAIPAQLFAAVAEVLAQLIRLKQLVL